MRIGYARVSTREQNEARQIEAFKDLGLDKWYLDKASGKNTDRPNLKEMLSYIREGDTVVVESISRIARNTKDLLGIVEAINDKNAEFVILKEQLDTTTPTGKFMLTVFGAMAELEREYILQRQAEGIEIAKSEGRYAGRPQVDIDETKFRSVCKEWRNGNIQAVEAMKKMGMSKPTFYRRVREMGL